MEMTVHHLLEKYNEVRTANRGLFFAKRKQIDLTTLEGIDEWFRAGNSEGVILNQDNMKIIMIFGSNELVDWLYNFWFRGVETPYPSVTRDEIKVHKGFYHSYLHIRDYIRQATAGCKQVLVYGQSHGAAVGTLAALDIQYNNPECDVRLLTTGSPLVGNKAFAESFRKYIRSYIRIVNGGDIVTGVPFKWLGGYVHTVPETHIGKRKKLRISITDHMVPRYIESLDQSTNIIIE